ncbi:MAG: hypothetical protein A7315_14295 [Candidatus Altiarchaeales archaeon WOR_SM1_79]|nr:MAG: hypothetical protein A7315_14295 [Candidatus Altiarchaeales archaeon WOR_SM1_79]
MAEILIKDGVKYRLWTPSKEGELERMVVHHSKDVFGGNSIYFDIKKKIQTNIGERTIPDGYLINFDTNEFCIIEVELSTHHEYRHINEQIGKFISALNNYQTRQKLARILKDYILDDVVLEKFVKKKVGDKEIYEFFLDILENVKEQKYSIVVIIDKKTKRISDACSILHSRPDIREFKTFAREGVDPKMVHVHLFEPLYETEIIESVKPSVEQQQITLREEEKPKRLKRGEKTNQKAYIIPILESLIEMGGSGRTKYVLDMVEQKMEGILKEVDYEMLSSGIDIRWENTAAWARNTMVQKGLLKPSEESGRGIWEISDEGRRYYEENKS